MGGRATPTREREQQQDDGLAQASTTGRLKWDDGDYYDMSYGISRSRRYHAKMHDFYQRWADITTFINTVLGTGAFLILIGGKDTFIAQILTGLVAVASSLAFTFGPAKKAYLHADLTKGFTDLAAKIVARPPTPENLAWAEQERLALEARELPVRRLVDLQADNEEARARGVSEARLIPLSGLQRFLGYCFTFGMKRLDKWKGESQTAAGRS